MPALAGDVSDKLRGSSPASKVKVCLSHTPRTRPGGLRALAAPGVTLGVPQLWALTTTRDPGSQTHIGGVGLIPQLITASLRVTHQPSNAARDPLWSLAKAVLHCHRGQGHPRAGAPQGLAHPTHTPGLISAPTPWGSAAHRPLPCTEPLQTITPTSLDPYKPGLGTATG